MSGNHGSGHVLRGFGAPASHTYHTSTSMRRNISPEGRALEYKCCSERASAAGVLSRRKCSTSHKLAGVLQSRRATSCAQHPFSILVRRAATLLYMIMQGLSPSSWFWRIKKNQRMVPGRSAAWRTVAWGSLPSRAPGATPAKACTRDWAECAGFKVPGFRLTALMPVKANFVADDVLRRAHELRI